MLRPYPARPCQDEHFCLVSKELFLARKASQSSSGVSYSNNSTYESRRVSFSVGNFFPAAGFYLMGAIIIQMLRSRWLERLINRLGVARVQTENRGSS
jgi:hypothetical protein